MEIPTDYVPGFEAARAVDPELASNYVAHTLIGDPIADELVEELAPLGHSETTRLLSLFMDGRDEDAKRNAPAALQDFFASCETQPPWLDRSAFIPGIRMFHRNSRLVLGAMVGGTLVEGFATNIAKSFFITGRLRDQGIRRLRQNNRHMVEIFIPGGLEREGDGWKLSVRIRLVHAVIRRLLSNSEDWNSDSWGIPISSAHLGFAVTAFSARLLSHLKNLGAEFGDDERAGFMAVWRYSGYLMGIPESILFRDEEDALRIYRIGLMCEPPPGLESIALSNSLINSAPLIAGVTDPPGRRRLANYVFRVSRALIGPPLADQLMYPHYPTIGVLPWFRLQDRYDRVMGKLFSSRVRNNNKLAALFDVSVFDRDGITYMMPDHVYGEESTWW